MNFLDHIPAVLVRDITESLGKEDLSNLCVTSKACRSIFEPELYRGIYWTYFHSQDRTSKPLQQLLRNILHRPKIAAWVQEFNVREVGFGPKPRVGVVFSSTELRLLHSLLDGAGIMDTENWISDLREGDAETLVATTLLQFREIRSLTLNLFFRHDDDCAFLKDDRSRICQVFQHAVSGPPQSLVNRFTRLRHISWPSESFPGPHCFLRRLELPSVMPAISLPVVESASLKIDQPETIRHDMLASKALGPSRLHTLRLRHSSINDDALSLITSAHPGLKNLDIEFTRDMRCLEDIAMPGFHGPTLHTSLNPCRPSLERLRIVCYISDPFLEVPWSCFFTNPLPSLRDFTRLSSLEISLTLLLGCHGVTAENLVHALPLSLSTLSLQEDGYDVVSVDIMEKALANFPAKAESTMLQLKTINFLINVDTWGDKRVDSLQIIYKSTRFKLTIIHTKIEEY